MRRIESAISTGQRLRACLLFTAAAVLTLPFAGCSHGTSGASGIQNRVFVSNQLGSGTVVSATTLPQPAGLQIINAHNDTLSPSSIGITGASLMVTAGGTNGMTAVVEAGSRAIAIVNNAKETIAQTFTTTDDATSVAIIPNAATAFAAVRNPGILNVITTANANGATIKLPSVARLVLSPKGTKLLAFVDDPQTLVGFPQNAFFIIDVATSAVTPVVRPGSCTSATACDIPYTAVFNNSETSAFILNCGAECGGTTASIVSLDFSGSPKFGTPISVNGATVGILSGSNLFVAGTPPGSATGSLQIINTGNSAVTGTFAITDGLHGTMAMASNNRLYVGAISCTPAKDAATGQTHGCLTIFNTGNSALVFPEFDPAQRSFDVTSVLPIANRTVVYVAEGGQLKIFDTNTDQLTVTQVSIIGQAVNLVQVDQ
jgi:hypothetical protein